ncbi:MAG: rubredoxin [Nanoarchaeota archaeon]|nr:rubredoxin [Nanoarchaeota archaeon]
MVLFKCNTCGYVSDTKIDVCPKCGSTSFTKLSSEAEKLIKKARKTNYLHMKISGKLVKLMKYAQTGVKENLDPACVKIFKRLEKDAYENYQMIQAEIAAHTEKKKWN